MKRIKYILFIMISLISLLASSLTVYAEKGNGDDDDGGKGTQKIVGGPSSSRCAYLLYIVDKNGNLLTEVVETTIAGCEEPPADAIYEFELSRFGGQAPSKFMGGADWGTPFTQGGNGRGSEIKNIMLSKNNAGNSFAYTVVEKYFGSDVAENWLGADQYLIIEAVYWARFQNGLEEGYWNVATAKGWAQAQNAYGCGEMGSKLINRYTNNIYANCMKFEYSQFGLPTTPSGKQTNDTIINTAAGVISIWGKEGNMQTTCDEGVGNTPHQAPDESEGTNNVCAIVKNYRTKQPNKTYVDDGCYVREKVSRNILIEDEVEYRVVGWKISNTTQSIDSISWNPPGSISKTGETAGTTVEIKKPSTCLSVLLERIEEEEVEEYEYDYHLAESQVTKAISLEQTEFEKPILKDYTFMWKYNTLDKCSGHYREGSCNEDCDEYCTDDHGWTEYCNFSLDNKDWLFKLKNINRENYPLNLAINDYWTDFNNEEERERAIIEEGIEEVPEREYLCVLHRGSDPITIAQWKNENPAIDSLETFNTANSKSPNRKKVDYLESINITWDDDFDTEDLITTAKGNFNCRAEDEAKLSNPLSSDINILYEVYSGDKQAGKINTDVNEKDMLTIGSVGSFVKSGRMVRSGLAFDFHPHVTYRYDTLSSDGNIERDILIQLLAEYKRGLNLNDYCEIFWINKEKTDEHGNLNLVSGMWSTHASAVQNHPTNSVGIGGMTWELNTKKNEETVILKTYQSIVMEGSPAREQINKTGSGVEGFTEATALDQHISFAQSVVNGFESLGVSQWVNRDESQSPFAGIKVYEGSDISSLKNTTDNKASTEDKYYFRQDSSTETGVNENDLDVRFFNGGTQVKTLEEATTTEYYVFKTDNKGNIYMNGSVILNKYQDETALSGKAKELDEKTYIVRKIVDALERGSGNDSENTWTDAAWYSEILDEGVAIAESTTTIKVGMFDPYSRTSVLDPKLTPKSKDKGDIFTKFYSTAFRTNDYSDTYGQKYVMGNFKGSYVKMNKLEEFFVSRKVYIVNYNTQNNH